LFFSRYPSPFFSQKYTTSESTAPKARTAYLDGRTYLQQGDAPRALRAFEKAIGEDSVFIEARLIWAETHFDATGTGPKPNVGFEKP
jgi:Tfp pilus assembly protein PilF